MTATSVRPPDLHPPADTPGGATVWDRLADRISRRPGNTLLLALVPLLLPLLVIPTLHPSHDTLAALPDDAESVQGFRALDAHLPAGETTPVFVVVATEGSVYEPETFRALGELSRAIRQLPGVVSVRSVAMPTDGRAPDTGEDPLEGALARLGDLTEGLEEAEAGALAIAGGVDDVGVALSEIERRLPELAGGMREARAGADALLDGLRRAREGVAALRAGMAELDAGVAQAVEGVAELRAEVVQPATAAVVRASEALDGFTIGRTDPRFAEVALALGEAHARLTGRFPPFDPRAGQQAEPGYDGLDAAMAELGDGLAEARDGIAALDAGLGDLDAGLAEIAAGVSALRDGLGEAEAGVAELQQGISALRAAVTERLAPGTHELAVGLGEGAAELDEAELADIPPLFDAEDLFVLTPTLLDAEPELRDELAFFTADRDRRTRMFVGLRDNPFSQGAIATVREISRTVQRGQVDTPLEHATVALTGTAVVISEVDEAASGDFPVIVAAVILGVFGVLVLLLRSIVVPLYMVITVLLTYGAALGTAGLVFQHLLGGPGLQWWIPPMLFVLLVVLGVDYSIFLMSRVREEAESRVTRDAVAEGVRRTGRVITSCGLILAGTFAALIVAPLTSLAQLGLAATVGILLDTFVVRALIVPSIATLLGRHNWWPSSRAHAA